MQQILIPFTLKNTGTVTAIAVLIGASTLANSAQKGRVLADTGFKSEDGAADIVVSGLAEGQSLNQMQEFIASYGCRVDVIKVTSDSFVQATTPFTERINMPVPPDQSADLPTDAQLGTGFDKHKVIHNFRRPFFTAPNKSLVVEVKPGKEVTIEMLVMLTTPSLV